MCIYNDIINRFHSLSYKFSAQTAGFFRSWTPGTGKMSFSPEPPSMGGGGLAFRGARKNLLFTSGNTKYQW